MSERWSRSVGLETVLFLHGLVASTGPKMVYECGAFPGRASAVLSLGGDYHGWESNPKWASIMGVHEGHPDSYGVADFSFIDCGPGWDDRSRCVANWVRTAPDGALAVIDDATYPEFDLGTPSDIAVLILPIGHGLYLCRKPPW